MFHKFIYFELDEVYDFLPFDGDKGRGGYKEERLRDSSKLVKDRSAKDGIDHLSLGPQEDKWSHHQALASRNNSFKRG